MTREDNFAAIVAAHRGPPQARVALDDLLETLQFGSLCSLGGFTPFPVRSALNSWPEDFA